MKIFSHFLFTLLGLGLVFFLPQVVLAHRSGCHNLHTCVSDNNSYVCGDLGYPCDGSTSLEQIPISKVFVPLAVEKMFSDVFGRKPTDTESEFWKKRFRSDKGSVYKIRSAMIWHLNKIMLPSQVKKDTTKEDLVKNMNSMFESVYGRMPTESENKYWLSRLKDKPTAPGIIGAMTFHKAHGIQH